MVYTIGWMTGCFLSLKYLLVCSFFCFMSIHFVSHIFSPFRWRFSDLTLAVFFFPFFSLFLFLVSICSGQYALNAHWTLNGADTNHKHLYKFMYTHTNTNMFCLRESWGMSALHCNTNTGCWLPDTYYGIPCHAMCTMFRMNGT